MRYFMTTIPGEGYDSGAKPVPREIMDAMGPYIEKVVGSGALISTGGLKRSSAGKRITGHSGRTVTTDGPFAEARSNHRRAEHQGGRAFQIRALARSPHEMSSVRRYCLRSHLSTSRLG